MAKSGFTITIILACIFFGLGLILAQEATDDINSLVSKSNALAKEINIVRSKNKLSAQDLKLISDLDEAKADVDRKIRETASKANTKDVNANNKPKQDMEKVYEASRVIAYLRTVMNQDKELGMKLKAEVFARELTQKPVNLAAVKAIYAQEAERLTKKREDELNDQCLNCKAVAANNAELCDKIQDESRLKSCREFFMILRLIKELNKNAQVTSTALDICKEAFGDNSEENPDNKCRSICNSYLTGDLTPVLSYFKGEDGLSQLAFLSADTRYCGYGSSEEGKQKECFGNAYFSSAIKSDNKELCSKINNSSLKAICGAYFDKDENKCDQFRQSELTKSKNSAEK